MTELLTAAQMRAIEEAAIESGAVTGLELMERAGRGVVDVIFEAWPALQAGPFRAVILCGPGNNGGDGFVIARLLKEWGAEVEVYLYGDPARLPPDARVNYERWTALGGVGDWAAFGASEADLVVDAIFGGGLTRPLPEDVRFPLADFQTSLMASRPDVPFVAVDGPSGICLSTGWALATDVEPPMADLAVTFHRPRTGHLLADGAFNCARLKVVDIGLQDTPPDAARAASPQVGLLGKGYDANKFGYGHALIVSGGTGKGGAARLAARGALRIGAGLVTVGCPADAMTENAARLDAIMLSEIDGPERLGAILSDPRISAVCLGPGAGLSTRTREMVRTLLATGRAAVLDADALTVFQDDPAALFDMLHPNVVLTPHQGEFLRLFPDLHMRPDLAGQGAPRSKIDVTREAAARAGCVILYKGADTVIADPTGAAIVHGAIRERAAPWLATAGSGDVLAGFITGLLSRGFGPLQAAETGAWLHAECARAFGPGLIAEDLPEELPKVFRELGL